MADSPTDYQLLFLQHNHRLKDVYFSFWTKCNGFYHNNRKETTLIMTIRLAINGFGRIGRNVLRALYTGHYREQLQVVAINDLGDAAVNAHLFQYDSVHGRFPGEVEHDAESLRVMGDRIAVSAIRNPAELPRKSLGVDIVLECTGPSPAATKPLPTCRPAPARC